MSAEFRPSWRNFFYCLFRSPTIGAAIAANILVLFVVPLNRQNAHNLLWVYWAQSVLIGLVHFLKLLAYRFAPPKEDPEKGNMSSWSQPAVAVFFLLHYGFFHFVYMFFLELSGVDWGLVWKAAAVFGGHLFLSSMVQFRSESNGTLDIGTFMFRPYLRIIPIHMAIIIGSMGGKVGVLLVLIILKTVVEVFAEYMDINRASLSEWIGKYNEKIKQYNNSRPDEQS